MNTRKRLAGILGMGGSDKRQNELCNREVSCDEFLGVWVFELFCHGSGI